MYEPENRDALFIPQDFRANFKQIIAKRPDLAQIDGGRLSPALFVNNTPVTYYPGQVLGFITSGTYAGYWNIYNASNTDGSQKAAGILLEPGGFDAFGNGSEIAILKEAVCYQNFLIGLDANAITDLNGVPTIEHGRNLIRIRA